MQFEHNHLTQNLFHDKVLNSSCSSLTTGLKLYDRTGCRVQSSSQRVGCSPHDRMADREPWLDTAVQHHGGCRGTRPGKATIQAVVLTKRTLLSHYHKVKKSLSGTIVSRGLSI